MIRRDALTQRLRQCGKAAVMLTIIVTGAVGTRAGRASDPGAAVRTYAEFARHLHSLIPALLEGTNVPGASVALVENGEVVWAQGFGLANVASERSVTADTIFNVGSISKPVTAWAVMTLVEQGKINLDDPIARYIKRWKLPESEYDAGAVTARRLLSHTAGLSLAAVPEYGADEEVPALPDALADADHGVRIVAQPGSKWDYSGGGYMLLQLMIEDVTETSFAEFVSQAVLKPLEMTRSGFDPSKMAEAELAAPYDQDKQSVPYYRYAGLAAAGLYSTANDLAKFVAAGLAANDNRQGGERVLKTESIKLMQSPADATKSNYIKYGLGYNLIPLPSGGLSAGHAGSNTGWMAVISTIPEQGDGFVLLTNSSSGVELYRWALCDWIEWKCGRNWSRFCDGREDQPEGEIHVDP